MITASIQWSENAQPESFTVSDEVLASLESYRLTLTEPRQTADGSWASVPKYATIKDLIVGVFIVAMVNPAVSMFPPAAIAAANEQVKAAQAALEAAKASAVMGTVVPKG